MIPDTIFFDKDGTLLDFDAFWVVVTRHAISDVLKRFCELDRKMIEEEVERILPLLGVVDGVTDTDGILCKGTYEQIAEVLGQALRKYNCEESVDVICRAVLEAYEEHADKGQIRPTCSELKETVEQLRNMGIRVCVVTTDNPQITRHCLETLGILEFFECVYTDDGRVAPKPDASCIEDYCRRTGVSRDRIWMVGDTMTDVLFAKNAGITMIGVGNANNRKKLEQDAWAVLQDVSYLPGIIGEN